MDRNSIIGLVIIAGILFGYSYFMAPSQEEMAKLKAKQDSIALVEKAKTVEVETKEALIKAVDTSSTAVVVSDSAKAINDSIQAIALQDKFGEFHSATIGTGKTITLENEKIKVEISTLGGKLVSAELKEYKTYGGQPLYLMDEDSSQFNLSFFHQNRQLNSSDFYFEPSAESITANGDDYQSVSFKLFAADRSKYIEFVYGLKGNDYMLDYKVNFVGLDDLVKSNANEIGLSWMVNVLAKEKGMDNERMNSTVYYKYLNDDEVDYLSTSSTESEKLDAKVHWISFKQQYFSSILICDNGFEKTGADIETTSYTTSKKYTKKFGTNLSVPIQGNSSSPMMFYLGPNHYQTLEDYNRLLEKQIDLGWKIFAVVNEYIVIPVFNFLDNFNMNYGIIILLLTIFIKTLLLPITYKNYLSSAKMKVLKPEIDAINEKHKNDDALKKQQAVMALYKSAGVNPLAGCIPALLQIPILYAMFRFFPASIELRQQSFLWAEDLSTYDSIYELGFSIPFYGDHISLFTVLMAISTFLYTKFSMNVSSAGNDQMALQMKIMGYIMPFMLLVWFNNYSAGLSYYYFAANMLSIGQQMLIKKWFIDEDAIHAKIQENKKRPQTQKKSAFQQKLEDMAKQRGMKLPK